MFWLRQSLLALLEDQHEREGSPGAESFCSALSDGAESFYSAVSGARSSVPSIYYDAEPSAPESSDSDSSYVDVGEEFATSSQASVTLDSSDRAGASGITNEDYESFSYGKIFEDVYGTAIHRPPLLASGRKRPTDVVKEEPPQQPARRYPRLPFIPQKMVPKEAARAKESGGDIHPREQVLSCHESSNEAGVEQEVLSVLERQGAADEFVSNKVLSSVSKERNDGLQGGNLDDMDKELVLQQREAEEEEAGMGKPSTRRCLGECQNGHWEAFEQGEGSADPDDDFETMSDENREIIREFDKYFEPCLDSEEEEGADMFDDVSEDDPASWGDSDRDEKGLLNKNALLGKCKRFPLSGKKKVGLRHTHSFSDGSRDGGTPKRCPSPVMPVTSSAGELTGLMWCQRSDFILEGPSQNGAGILDERSTNVHHQELTSLSSLVTVRGSFGDKENQAEETKPFPTSVKKSVLSTGNDENSQARSSFGNSKQQENFKTVPVPPRPLRRHSPRKEVEALAPGEHVSSCIERPHRPARSARRDIGPNSQGFHRERDDSVINQPVAQSRYRPALSAHWDITSSGQYSQGEPNDTVIDQSLTQSLGPARSGHRYVTSSGQHSQEEPRDAIIGQSITQSHHQAAHQDVISRDQHCPKELHYTVLDQSVAGPNGLEPSSSANGKFEDPVMAPLRRRRSHPLKPRRSTSPDHPNTGQGDTLVSKLVDLSSIHNAVDREQDVMLEHMVPHNIVHNVMRSESFAQDEPPVPAKRRFHREKQKSDSDMTGCSVDLPASYEMMSEIQECSRILQLPFSLSQLTGKLFDDDVPLDVVSLHVVHSCDFLKAGSDNEEAPFIMKLGQRDDLSAYLVDPHESAEYETNDFNYTGISEDSFTIPSEYVSDTSVTTCDTAEYGSFWGVPKGEGWDCPPPAKVLQTMPNNSKMNALEEPSCHGLSDDNSSEQILGVDSSDVVPDSFTAKSNHANATQAEFISALGEADDTLNAAAQDTPQLENKQVDVGMDEPQEQVEPIEQAIDGLLEQCVTEEFGDWSRKPSDSLASGSPENLQKPHGSQRYGGGDCLPHPKKNSKLPSTIWHVDHLENLEHSEAPHKKQVAPPSTALAGTSPSLLSARGDSCPPLGFPAGGLEKLLGRERGIQGHHNSCYLDATLFAMFSCTEVFDHMLYRPRRPGDIDAYDEIQAVLRNDIVHTLRREMFVPHKNVMKLRELLNSLGGVSGLTTEEKDPEEFLNSLIMALGVEPYLKLSSGQDTHLYQLFVEKHDLLEVPTVQQLFHHSIHDSNIKLKEIPSALIIQMPRFGKQFKVYPCIIPSLVLDITDALENSPRFCFVCGRRATCECRDCFRPDVGLEGTSYCDTCSEAVHRHPARLGHETSNLPEVCGKERPAQRQFMELIAVVCIETSHYVCFVKCPKGDKYAWCFFDSMADREGGEDGHNIPEVTEFLDYNVWLGDHAVENVQERGDSKFWPTMGRRLVCDAYMCIYRSPLVSKYN